MKFDRLDYKKLLPISIVIFIAFIGLLFYFFAQAFNSSPANKANTLGTYSNPQFEVTFNYPGTWNQIGGYDYDHFEGDNGFFGVSSAGGDVSLEEVTREAYDHPLLPYGKHPVLENLKVDGQPAKLIVPSDDQDPSLKGQAALIVKYPTPVKINGNTYYYFVLWADKENIQTIIPTIVFRT